MSLKLDLLWSPNREEEFVTFGQELTLFQVVKTDSSLGSAQVSGATRISDSTLAIPLSVNSEIQYVKCVAWYPGHDPHQLIAVGQANGRIILVSFGQGGNKDPNDLVGKEFGPRHARQCNSLVWNTHDNNLLAQGLDKYRQDASLLVWDVNAKPAYGSSYDSTATPDSKRGSTFYVDTTPSIRPVAEIGAAESVYSLCWSINQPKILLTGMNKYLRVYDIRESTHPQNAALTKNVFGLCVDPHSADRVASFSEGQISVWDLRNFDKPVLTFTENRQIMKLSWCSTRSGLLTSLMRDWSMVKLYDIQHTTGGSDEMEPVIIERLIQPGQHSVGSFTWHPTQENRMLTISSDGQIRDVTVFERIALAWSPSQMLAWSCGKKLIQCSRVQVPPGEEDVAEKMKYRAMRGYGLQTEQVWQNTELVGNDRQLKSMWSWIDTVRSLWQEGKLKTMIKNAPKYYGIKSILRGEVSQNGVTNFSEYSYAPWEGVDGKNRLQPKLYKSDERKKCLQLCCWDFDSEAELNTVIDRLESDGEYERAALVALFNLKIKRALDVLNKGASGTGGDVNLSIVAMALSGFSDDKNTLWRDMWSNALSTSLKNANLRSMFAFLTSGMENFDAVLNEEDMCVQDRVAFACMYLCDSKLMEYIDTLTAEMINGGVLEGILLTGFGRDGVDLLQKYVDNTGDVQTASLAVVQALPGEISKDIRVQTWIESYRSLLDRWGMWYQRAEFDVRRASCDASIRPPTQVFASCNFCGKSISSSANRRNQFLSYGGGPAANKPKVTACPGCRKPLPRCALCLIHMGTSSGTASFRHKSERTGSHNSNVILAPFSDWFTWCQSCRHGGHSQHIADWFRDHSECPVTGCTCKCMTLDSMYQAVHSEEHGAT
ncbi:GATOR complex protein MIOS-like isoform X2 [Lingula anatina]|uniref:GATOR complex protein MIOS-like isoform X2 n=1 Tax=Lingula anatina TaxID=7574 RepID=A0A1S3INI8_LINAN|nr:GATOR complex protein MIOS-like isoform X2 [Lingula anatina]|eukprot:XP_013399099.1 GATOR complex protein MIOS-like isoform X2 [Lingula anatina]